MLGVEEGLVTVENVWRASSQEQFAFRDLGASSRVLCTYDREESTNSVCESRALYL